ncbi:DUF4202 domain-containing protein [Actinospongicola halichondriae]|uniref:DUF4202 domain-containing protein n=1 Tax=Actinospongicola halichondriae TaxID=3236844 RepID=UPI003D38DEBE
MSERFSTAIARIDAANADDPNTIEVDGEQRPKEQAHAEMASAWLRHLDPDASELQLLAARAHHLRRWSLPRTTYPEGRAGYLRWRADLKKQHAAEVGAILADVGYDADEIDRVGQIIEKRELRSDPEVQSHEDALCLVFLQTQVDETLAKLPDDERRIEVLRKTAQKMSSEALEIAGGLDYSPSTAALLRTALGD